MTDTVRYERQGRLAIITMNRPERLNALNAELVEELAQAWSRYQHDEEAWIAILSGEGRAFSVGLDLKEASQQAELALTLPRGATRDPYWHEELDKPTIAAVNGYAYGGGFFLAARADLRVAAESAAFQITEVVRGGVAGYAVELTHNLPSAIAAELAVGETLTARRAYEVGFLNRLAPDGQTLDVAIRLAKGILERPPLAVYYNLRLARELRNRRIPEETFSRAKAWHAEISRGHDARESVRAFVERRKPEFRRE